MEKITDCAMSRVVLTEDVWSVLQCYGTQLMLKISLNRLLMQEIFDKLDDCE